MKDQMIQSPFFKEFTEKIYHPVRIQKYLNQYQYNIIDDVYEMY
jgi:hypothetical protein